MNIKNLKIENNFNFFISSSGDFDFINKKSEEKVLTPHPLIKVVEDYAPIIPIKLFEQHPQGNSASPKPLAFHILEDNSCPIQVLDIGFGVGTLGVFIKQNSETSHWEVDGIDGFEANCHNPELIGQHIYRNIWHGLAQDIDNEQFQQYHIICLLDVIEHLPPDIAKQLLFSILSNMNEDAFLFISTPLWFYPQDTMQEGDLEEHLIGVPASSMMALLPKMYAINHPLVGGFVLAKRSLEFIEFFQPTTNKKFSYEQGMEVAKAVGCYCEPGTLIKKW